MSVAAAKHQPKAAIGAAYTILPTAKVRVQLRSNATKVQVTYRSARNAKRSTVKELKRGAATLTLPAGSKRITVRAKATRKLAASPWIRATRLAPPAQGDPIQQPAPGGATTGTIPDMYTVDTYIPPTITHLATYATMASGTWEIVSEYRIVAPMPYILMGDYANDYTTVHPAGESTAFERETNPVFTRGDGCMALSLLSVSAPTRGLLFYTYGASDGIGGNLLPFNDDTMYYSSDCPVR